jgi:hypothetical protein
MSCGTRAVLIAGPRNMVRILVLLMLLAAPVQGQVADTTGIFSDKQLRQRAAWTIGQLNNLITAAEASRAHALVTYDHINRRIVRDSLRAVAPPPVDSIAMYLEDVPYVSIPSLTMGVGETRRICSIVWAGGKPRLPKDISVWSVVGPLSIASVGWNCAEVTALAETTLNVGSPAAYRIAMNSIRRRR